MRSVEGFPNYAVCEDGRVWSIPRTKGSGTGYHKPGCFLKPVLKKTGYLQLTLRNGTKTKTFRLHQLVAQAFIPNPDNLPVINHKNGIKTDNRVENLEWVTHQENCTHAQTIGLRPIGTPYRRKRDRWKEMKYDRRVIV
jgi:hypothetical protein